MNNNCYIYNYIDLRLHPHMYNYHGYKDVKTFFRYVISEEKNMISDYSEELIHEALRRQFEHFVGIWTDECENAAQSVIDKIILELH